MYLYMNHEDLFLFFSFFLSLLSLLPSFFVYALPSLSLFLLSSLFLYLLLSLFSLLQSKKTKWRRWMHNQLLIFQYTSVHKSELWTTTSNCSLILHKSGRKIQLFLSIIVMGIQELSVGQLYISYTVKHTFFCTKFFFLFR